MWNLSKKPYELLILFFYRYIVDSGFVKQLNHNSRVGLDLLDVVPISKWVMNVQAINRHFETYCCFCVLQLLLYTNVLVVCRSEAQQRAGRAGRTSPGKCFRIYNKAFWDNCMPEYTVPEIQRTSLTSVILTLKCLGVHDVIRYCLLWGFSFNEARNWL